LVSISYYYFVDVLGWPNNAIHSEVILMIISDTKSLIIILIISDTYIFRV